MAATGEGEAQGEFSRAAVRTFAANERVNQMLLKAVAPELHRFSGSPRIFSSEISSSATGDQAQEEGQDDRSDDRDEDGIEEAA